MKTLYVFFSILLVSAQLYGLKYDYLETLRNFPPLPGNTLTARKDKEVENGVSITKEDFVELCQRYVDVFYNKLDLFEKTEINNLKTKLKDKSTDAKTISATAVMVSATASSEYLPIVMSAIAALSAPDAPLIANNFGATVRTLREGDIMGLHELDDSIIALLYAKSLQPESPLILTNLGNSYIDKEKFAEAEENYRAAIKQDDDFCAAHEGMARVYIHKKDGKRAVDELIKAGKLGFSPSMRKGYREAKKCGGYVDSPFWEDNNTRPESQDDENEAAHDDKLILPVLPRWESKDVFIASLPNLVDFAQKITEKSMIGGLDFAAKYHADELKDSLEDSDFDTAEDDEGSSESDDHEFDDEDDEYPEEEALGVQDIEVVEIMPSYGYKLFMLELVNDYYSRKIEQEYNKNSARRKQIDEKYKNGLINIEKSVQLKQVTEKIMQGDMSGAKQLAKEINKHSAELANMHFAQWRDMTLDTYGRIKPLLYEYWEVAYEVTGEMYNQDATNYFNDVREITVYMSLLPIALDFSLLPQNYALADYLVPIVTADEDLSQYEIEPLSDIEMPDKEMDDCPFEGMKVPISLGMASFAITCDMWELELLKGIGGALKQNFKTGDTEITVLVGAKAGIGGAELYSKHGVTFKFDQKGDFTGWSAKSETGAKVGIGPVSVGQSLEYSSDIGMIASPKIALSLM